jgi:hypothetical protein
MPDAFPISICFESETVKENKPEAIRTSGTVFKNGWSCDIILD